MSKPIYRVGAWSQVAQSAIIGEGVVIGSFCLIEDDVVIGAGTHIRNYVELRSGTVIGENCRIDSYVVSSGDCRVGNDVVLRYGVIVAKGCDICDSAYLSPRVMTNNVDHMGRAVGGARIGEDCFIGTHAVIAAGIYIYRGAVVGACAMVTRSIDEPGIYVGIPARKR